MAIKFKTLLAPATIYQHAARYAEGQRPTTNSRFGVVRSASDAPWLLIHIRSGSQVGSLLPALSRKLTLRDLLAVASAFEAATHLDWAPFDNLPEIQPGDTKHAGFAEADRPAAQRTANELMAIARQALDSRHHP